MNREINLHDQAIDFQRAQAASALGVVAETYLDLLENDHDRESIQALGSKATAARAIYESAQLSIDGIEIAKSEAVIPSTDIGLPYPLGHIQLTGDGLRVLARQIL